VIHRRDGDGWAGVIARAYDDPALSGVLKYDLIGDREGAPHYEIRYFHVPPGGRTAREQHPHDHGVVIVTGRARVTLGSEQHEVGEGDVVYVAEDELHCFEALDDEPLGFLCIVPARRQGGAPR
jgi:quercetin dioxygenase-like cupin family protein